MNTVFYPPLLAGLGTNKDSPKNVVVDAFDSSYYSGLDVGIYVENFYLDQAVQLQYQVVENRTPYYGYNSYTYNRAAAGTRLVQGTFAINFKNTYYIYVLLDAIRTSAKGNLKKINPTPKALTSIKSALSGDFTLEDFLKAADSSASADAQLKGLHALSDSLTDTLWGGLSESPLAPSKDRPLFDSGPRGLSIYIKYGEPLAPVSSLRSNLSNPSNLGQRIADLQDPMGAPNTTRIPQHSPGTVHKLSGVEITGVGQSINDSGQCIMEIYSFIASDLDDPS